MGNTYTVERSAVIDAPPRRVFPEVANFHRWQTWSPWEDVDPDMRRSYSGAGAGTGAVYEWSGNRKAGAGRMQITRADEPSLVHVDLRFTKPFKSENDMRMTFEPEGPTGSQTRVTWTLEGPMTLMTRVMGVFTSMDKLVGPDFEKGLQRLKAVAESSNS